MPVGPGRVFCVDEGDHSMPPLALLHGFPSSSADFRPALPGLRERFRVIAHDHLGFGLSDKPIDYSYSLIEQADAAIKLWQHLGLERVHVLAHDYGTSVATELLARRERGQLPLDIASLTLCNGSVHIELAKLRVAQRILRHPTWGPVLAKVAGPRFFARRIRGTLARPDAISSEEIQLMWDGLAHNGGRTTLPLVGRYIDERHKFWHRWIGALTRLDLPCHILWGRADSVAVAAIAEALAAETPGATLTWLEGLGHYPMLEGPEAWTAAVLAWLRDHQ